jgi:peptidoglycan/xylan/chitin deacetylase (PgdA/CDA1 family)
MFHHFHGTGHAASQGSISAADLARILDYLGCERILGAQEWQKRALAGQLGSDDLCLTFDDALRSQIDVALPVLEDRGLTAFWFVYSEAFGTPVRNVEIFRAFRHDCYPDIEAFYREFEAKVLESPFAAEASKAISSGLADSHLAEFDFYTCSDRRFRYLRDKVLGKLAYEDLMLDMMAASGYDVATARRHLWMSEDDLLSLHRNGHVVGLHSFSHPTELGVLSHEEQMREYGANKEHLEKVLGSSVISMSHPCNSYDSDTLSILKGLGIRLGFRSNMAALGGSLLECPREDHAMVMHAMGVQ